MDDVQRASGDCVCDVCHKKYYNHPYDTRYPLPESMWVVEGRPEYYLRKLCDGRTVKL